MTGLRSAYHLPGMDCPTEEAMVRSRLDRAEQVQWVHVDLERRTIVIGHDGAPETLDDTVHAIGLGSRRLDDEEARALVDALPGAGPEPVDPARQRRNLGAALAVNAFGFVLEVVLGLRYGSVAVVADGLDMGADVVVYALALAAIGASVARQRLTARIMGLGMLLLALGGIAEVVHRTIDGTPTPDAAGMAWVSIVALGLNVTAMLLVRGVRHGGEHLRSMWIMTSTDVQANLVVLATAGLVALTDAAVPDLVVGTLVFLVVAAGAVRILRRG